MTISDSWSLVLALLSSSAAKFLGTVLWRKQKEKTFEYVGDVSALNLYPVKSCSPMNLQSVRCTKSGLSHEGVYDRHWIVVKEDGMCVNIQREPRMTKIKTSIQGQFLCLDAPGMPTLQLEKTPKFTKAVYKTSKVQGKTLTGIDCGREASQWISKCLETPGLSILVSNTGIAGRRVADLNKPWINVPSSNDKVTFAEVSAVNIANEGSLSELNSRLTVPVTMGNFRPCIAIKGPKAFDEDGWTELRIGDEVYMRILEPNPRCLLITVNPDGKRNADSEPLKTLRKYRKSPLYGDSPLFGMNMAVDKEGMINMGDPVYALRKV